MDDGYIPKFPPTAAAAPPTARVPSAAADAKPTARRFDREDEHDDDVCEVGNHADDGEDSEEDEPVGVRMRQERVETDTHRGDRVFHGPVTNYSSVGVGPSMSFRGVRGSCSAPACSH